MKNTEIIFGCIELGIPIVSGGRMYKELPDHGFCRAVNEGGIFIGYRPTSKAMAISSMASLSTQDMAFYQEVYQTVRMCMRSGVNPHLYRHVYESDYLMALGELEAA